MKCVSNKGLFTYLHKKTNKTSLNQTFAVFKGMDVYFRLRGWQTGSLVSGVEIRANGAGQRETAGKWKSGPGQNKESLSTSAVD